MVWWWWIIPAAVGIFGVAFVLSGLGWMFRGKPFKGGRGVVSGGALLAIGAVASLLGLNIQSYNRLTWERPAATVSLAQVGEREFDATVTELDANGVPVGRPYTYRITGDQWQMDARVITWKPWANILGLDTQYELQRIWGRHVTGPERNTAKAEDLEVVRPGIDFLQLSDGLKKWSPVDVSQREFGSAVFMPMVDGAVYEVKINQRALAVDPGNDIARGAIAAGGLMMQRDAEAAEATAAPPAQ